MLGKTGQWLCQINGTDIKGEELIFLNIQEEVGLNLPTLHMQFYTDDYDKVKRWNTPGHKIKIGLGVNTIEQTITFHNFKRSVSNMAGGDQWSVEIHGVYDALDYLTLQRMEVFNTWGDML